MKTKIKKNNKIHSEMILMEENELEAMISAQIKNENKEIKNGNNSLNDSFETKDYIQTLEMTVDMLQNELRETVSKMVEMSEQLEGSESSISRNLEVSNKKNINNNTLDCHAPLAITVQDFEIPDFSESDSLGLIFDLFYNFLLKQWQIVELDLFLVDENKNVKKLQNINSSINLENIFNDLEERGLLDWAANSNEIKSIPNLENIETVKSLIIIPVKMLNKTVAYFIANSTLSSNEINLSQSKIILTVAQNVYYLANIINSESDKKTSSLEYSMLRNQTLLASNQIALSEIVIALNDELELPLKVIKTNIDLIQKGVGDSKRRGEIINEQFLKLVKSHKLMQNFGNQIEHIPAKYNFIEIMNQTFEVLENHLSKNGITVSMNFDEASLKNENIFGFKSQLIFSILNIILNSTSTMPSGGKINIGIFKNEENSTVSLILTDDGIGMENFGFEVGMGVSGDLIPLMDLSDKKIKSRFLFLISQHIISQHNGKFSVYSELGKGTTYKILLPTVE